MVIYASRLFSIVWMMVVLISSTCAMEIKNLSQAVDVAGKQRMYTQRMLKDYAMIGLNSNFGNPKKDLADIMSNFEDHLKALRRFNKDEATRASLDKVRILWDPIKKILSKEPDKNKAAMLQESLEALLNQANESTNLFAKQTGKESGEIINISGRQRMLSQRMASLYLLKAWGIDDPKFKNKLDKTMELFSKSHDKLVSYEKNTPRTLELLHNAARAFIYFEYMKNADIHVPYIVFKKTMKILKNMNTATGLYAKIGAKESETGR